MDDNEQGQRRAMTQVAATRDPTYSHCLISLSSASSSRLLFGSMRILRTSVWPAWCVFAFAFLQVTGSSARPANGKREHNYGPQSVLRIFKQLQLQRNRRTLCRPIKLYSLIRGIMPAAWQDSYC